MAALIIGLLVIVAVYSPTQGKAPTTKSDSVLVSSEKMYDFGTISMAKGLVIKQFKIKNETSDSITVKKIFTSCMCTTAVLLQGERRIGPFGMEGHGGPIPTISENIYAGSETAIEVTFDPAAHGPAGVGTIDRNVLIQTTDGKQLVLGIKAQVVP